MFHEGTFITARAGDSTARWHDSGPLGSNKISFAAQAKQPSEEKHYPQRNW
nr:hypothetical protein [Candidatus Sigynarchaeota archaeon]